MAKNNESSVTFKVFNQDFNKAMSEMEASAKKMRQELKLEQEQLKLTGSESEKLKSVLNSLQKQYDIAKQKTQATEQQLEAVKKQFGENSTEAGKMETKLRSMQIAEQQLANRISETSQSLNKAKQAESETISSSEKNRQAIQQLEKEQNNLRSASERLLSEYKLQKAQMGENVSEAEKLTAAEEHVRKQAEITKQEIANLEKQLALTEQEYGKNSDEANKMATRLNAAKASIANFENELENIRNSSNDAAEGMDDLGKKISVGNFIHFSEILSGASDRIRELGSSSIEGATEMADSQQDIQANLGVTGKEAERLQSVVKNVFEHGVTESVETASKAVQSVKGYMGDLNNQDLEKVTNKVIAIGKHTDTDVNENVRAASQLMNHFGVSADDSLDLIAAGFQDGLNKSDDFLDTLNEYSPQFAQAGFRAKDMLNVIDKGMKSGAFNTDKAADAVKEFGIRLKDGTIQKNIGLYSQHTQELFKEFQAGKATSAQVFQSINKDIANTDNATQKYNMGVTSMGTQYEDLGDKAVSAFAQTGNAIDNVNGKADQMAKRSPGEKWQQSLRELKDDLATIGQDLMADLIPIIKIIGDMAKGFGAMPAPIRIVVEVIAGLVVALTMLAPVIGALSVVFGAFSVEAGVLTLSIGSLNIALLPVIAVIAAVAAVVAGIVLVIKNWGAITDWLKGVWSGFSSWISNLWRGISNDTSKIWGGMKSFFSKWWPEILAIMTGPLGIMVLLITKNWNSIKSTTSTVWNAIKNVVSSVWNAIKSGASTAINAIKSTVSRVWNSIKSATSSTWNAIKSAISKVWSAIKSSISNAINSVKSTVSKVWNSIRSVTSSAWNGARSVITGVWSGIKSGVSSSINTVKSKVSSVWNGIRSTTTSVWNGIKNAIVNPIQSAKNMISVIISKIKGFFTGLHFKIPKISIPMPHFHIKGKFSLKPPSVPHLSVDWYANGGFFDQASIIGIGEAGPEAALPLSGKRMNPFADAVANRMLSTLPQIADSKLGQSITNNNNPVFNVTVRNDQDMNKLVNTVDKNLGTKSNRKKAAWGG